MDQKLSDFQALAALYDKRYGPYDWKVKATGFDMLNVAPWLAKVQETKTDLDYYEVLIDYLAALNDGHAFISLPATFQANLNFTVDLFDGKLLVDTVNRTRLPVAEFPFLAGYELVTIDNQDAQKILDGLLQYNTAGNERSTRRLAAQYLTLRPQLYMPHAADAPEISTVVFRRPDGSLESYRIPWTKTGLPLTSIGSYITPKSPAVAVPVSGPAPCSRQGPGVRCPVPLSNRSEQRLDSQANYMQAFERLWNCSLPDRALVGVGSLAPVYAASLPATFVQRLGKVTTDPFYSGVLNSGGFKIGFIRIPSFTPTSQTTALNAFIAEMTYFQANTDGLVIDVMRNPGGTLSYTNTLLSFLMPAKWNSVPFELRATSEWVAAISSSLVSAQSGLAPQATLDALQKIKDAIVTANQQVRGTTDPIPLDGVTIDRDPALDSKGNVIAYTKPIMVLMDELTASASEAFAATIQDNTRGVLFGYRTMGAGGQYETWEAGSYSQGVAYVTESLMRRSHDIVTSDYPAAPYIENIGVRPDLTSDYMTRDNLTQNGKPFVDAWVAAMVSQLQKGK